MEQHGNLRCRLWGGLSSSRLERSSMVAAAAAVVSRGEPRVP